MLPKHETISRPPRHRWPVDHTAGTWPTGLPDTPESDSVALSLTLPCGTPPRWDKPLTMPPGTGRCRHRQRIHHISLLKTLPYRCLSFTELKITGEPSAMHSNWRTVFTY